MIQFFPAPIKKKKISYACVKSPNYTYCKVHNTQSPVTLISLTPRSHVEYVEEFPVQAMPVFPSISGHEISSGVIVMLLQYGTRKIDFLGKDRAEKEWAKAWKSNFLHPVLYYYQTLPTSEC